MARKFKLALASLAAMISCAALHSQNVLPQADSRLKDAIVAEGSNESLQRLFAKADKGGKIVIGAIGGSITEGAACSNPERRYHGVMLKWLKSRFPKADFVLVNAGIGATGSDYGSMRVQRDLLSRNPDFVILEFAVNDSNTKEQAESYEGVVRQILNAPSRPALALLFMMRKDGGNAQEWESKIGERYKLPMISYRDALWPEIQAGRLKWEQISPDSVHPNEAGHSFAGELLCAWLAHELKAFQSGAPARKAPPALPEPLISSRFEHCALLDGEALAPTLAQGWAFDPSGRKSAGWKSATPGSVLDFEIEGESIFIAFWRINGPMGIATASVDGGRPARLDAWFEKTWGGYRQTVRIAEGLPPGRHKVKVTLLQERNPQSSGNEFILLGAGSIGIVKSSQQKQADNR